jgi:Na+-transporting NADH:ubiquinone oxidoreductase subunit F
MTNEFISVNINNGQKILIIKKGMSLLAALASNKIFLPSACGGHAQCGYCKIKVISPQLKANFQELPLLSSDDIKNGIRLACQTKPDNDIIIQISQEVLLAKRFYGEITQKKLLTADIIGLKINLTNPTTINFKAGQFIQLKSAPYNNNPSVLREFSISSCPSNNSYIELMIKRVPNGICTTWIFDYLKVGDKISFLGPYGQFGNNIYESNNPAVFIAGGSGMAPVWSILQELSEKKSQRKIYFFYGAQTQKALFLVNELYQLEKTLPNFKFIPALSNESPNSSWKGECGKITDVVEKILNNCNNYDAYLCGSPGMINACISVLKKCGIKEERIYYDKFS